MTTTSRRPRGRGVRAVLAVVLAVVGVLLLWSSLVVPSTPGAAPDAVPTEVEGPTPSSLAPTPLPKARRSSASSGRSDVRDRTAGLVLPESDPLSVAIPRIGVRSRLVELGLDHDGAMEVPQDPSLAGWFTPSAAPGELGPAVIAGHVTWDRAPAVFSRLGDLRRGDQVTVKRK